MSDVTFVNTYRRAFSFAEHCVGVKNIARPLDNRAELRLGSVRHATIRVDPTTSQRPQSVVRGFVLPRRRRYVGTDRRDAGEPAASIADALVLL